MIPEPQKLLLFEATDALRKSWWTVVAGVCVGLAVAIVAFRLAPVVFEAQAVILADVERLPDEFIQPTVSTEDGLELKLKELKDEVMREENLIPIVADVYPGAMTLDRQRYLASLIGSRTTVIYSPRSKSIQLSFVDSNAERAALIVDAIADLFVSENVHLRTKDAALLTTSLERLGSQIRVELDTLKQELDEIRRKHPYETDDHRDANEKAVREAEQRLEDVETAISLANQRIQALEAQRSYAEMRGSELYERPSGPTTGGGESPRVAELRAEIENLKHRYREDHPSVQAKQRELEDLLRANDDTYIADDEEESVPSEESATTTPSIDIWEVQVRAARLEQTRLEETKRELERSLSTHRAYLANTAAIQREIDDLAARISLKRNELLEHESKIAQSKFGERIEEQELGNPFAKPYDAAPPMEPISPDPLQFLVIGIAAGLALFVGPVLAKTFLVPTIGSELALSMLADVSVLVSIPVIQTPQVVRQVRRGWLRNFALSGAAMVLLAAVISLDRIGVL